MGVYTDATLDSEQRSWARDVSGSVAPWSLLGGGYLNYAAHDEPADRLAPIFGHDRWARLVEVKRRYDPDNVLRHNANIKP